VRLQVRVAIALALCLSASGCARHGFRLPQGPGEPFADYERAFDAASAGCRNVRTLTAEASVSGTVGRGKIRGRVIAGFERPGRMRLEGVAPIGPPAFILAADGRKSTLLMPRASEVLSDQSPESVLEALVGVSLRPDDLQAILTGCVAPDPKPTGGKQFAGGWASIDLEGGSTAFMRQEGGQWRIRAGVRPLVSVEYEFNSGDRLPQTVHLRGVSDGGPGASLQLSLSQVEMNTPIAAKAFTLTIPSSAVPITLAELRQAGPLGERR
jgi:outer membrane lipoprotein-sorting protein